MLLCSYSLLKLKFSVSFDWKHVNIPTYSLTYWFMLWRRQFDVLELRCLVVKDGCGCVTWWLSSNYVCLSTRHLLGKHHSTLRTLSGQWLICHRERRRGQHSVAICFCHEHVESSETERLPSRPHASGIVYPLTSNSTSRRRLKTVLFNRGFAEYM